LFRLCDQHPDHAGEALVGADRPGVHEAVLVWLSLRTVGSPWKLVHPDGQTLESGDIVESQPPQRLVIRWQDHHKPELKAEAAALCTMELEPSGATVRLSVTHSIEGQPSKLIKAVAGGWPKVISNLKSQLETGSPVLQDSYRSAVSN